MAERLKFAKIEKNNRFYAFFPQLSQDNIIIAVIPGRSVLTSEESFFNLWVTVNLLTPGVVPYGTRSNFADLNLVKVIVPMK